MKLTSSVFFSGIYILISIICFFSFSSYGITGDEETQNRYGTYVWDYTKNFGNPIKSFEEYHPGHDELKFYGGIFDGIAAMCVDIFSIQDEFFFRHFLNTLFGLLTILYSGLIVYALTQSWVWASLGLFFLVLTPRFYGEMFNNPKDIPFAAGYIISIFYILRFLNEFEKPKWGTVFGLAMGVAISVGVRIGGILVIAYFGLTYIMSAWMRYKLNLSLLKTSMIRAVIGIGLGYLIACFWWPFSHENIVSKPLEALEVMSNYPLSIYMLFEGMRINTADLPSNYLFRWIYIGSPIFILLGLIIGSIYGMFEIIRVKSINLFILMFGIIFPMGYIIYKKSVVYDGLRHLIFILPLISIIACYGYYRLGIQFKERKSKYFIFALIVLLMIPTVKHSITNHPNQYVYFNELYGGVNKAFGYYETDYYHNSGKLATDWIKKNILSKNISKLKILSNMGTVHLYFQGMDTNKVQSSYGRWRERDHLDWDYYVAYSRFIEPENLQNGAWPPGKVIHTIKVDDVPVCVVMQRLNKDDIAAYEALNKGDMISAANLYQKNLSIDNSNEYTWYYYSIALANTGRINEAIEALKTAIQLNSSNPEWTNQLQKYYQMYAAGKVR